MTFKTVLRPIRDIGCNMWYKYASKKFDRKKRWD